MDSLSYCICSPSKELLVLKKIDFEATTPTTLLLDQLTTILAEESFLQLSFQETTIHWTSPYFTIIPNKLYSEADKAQYLLPLKETSEVAEMYLADPLFFIDSKLIYTIPTDLHGLLMQPFNQEAYLQHSFSALIEKFREQAGKKKELFVNVRDYWLQIFFFDHQELIFVNQFQFPSEKDFLYYVLLAYDQFKLDPNEVPLHIAGMLFRDSTIYQQLYLYIRHLDFVDLPAVFRSDLDLKEYPKHLFFDILNLA